MSFNTSVLPNGFSWVPASSGTIPPNAVVAWKEKSGDTLYVARIADGNVTFVGKCGQHVHGAIAACNGREQFFNHYEVLCGRSPGLKWVERSGQFDISKLNGSPILAGNDGNGAALFVTRVKVASPAFGKGGASSVGLQPGKISAFMKGASATFNGMEYIGSSYEVLVYQYEGLAWTQSSGGNIPAGAIEGGHENDSRGALYICRGVFQGGDGRTSLQVGKAAGHLGGGSFGYDGRETFVSDVEVLTGNASVVKWVSVKGRLDPSGLSNNPVFAGIDDDGSVLYAARASYQGGLQVGKVSQSFGDGAHFGADNKENTSNSYEVLCYR